jgi:hypothetical protein
VAFRKNEALYSSTLCCGSCCELPVTICHYVILNTSHMNHLDPSLLDILSLMAARELSDPCKTSVKIRRGI